MNASTTSTRGSRHVLATIVVTVSLAALGAGAAAADATMSAVGGAGNVTVTAKGDNTGRECDVGVLDQSKRTIASKVVSLAPNRAQTVKLASIPAELLHRRHAVRRPEWDRGRRRRSPPCARSALNRDTVREVLLGFIDVFAASGSTKSGSGDIDRLILE